MKRREEMLPTAPSMMLNMKQTSRVLPKKKEAWRSPDMPDFQ
tara:strand:+ start:213 stop:338 length:126 start_codon:yes stop_codon:yes gene_type:complete